MREGKVEWIIFSLVSLFLFLLYFTTQSPTVVFWDVGEFLATSAILGVPHPPGTPLYVILGHFMSLLPLPLDWFYKVFRPDSFPQNLVLKITLISVLTGALTGGFVYLITVRVLKLWVSKSLMPLVHICAVFSAIIGSIASVVWFNSTEAETYTPANFVIILATWLTLKWWEMKDDPKSIYLLIFIGYIQFLFSGIHLGALVGFPAVLLFVFVVKRELIWDLRLVSLFVIVFSLILSVKASYEPTLVSSLLLIFFQIVGVYYFYMKREFDINDVWLIGAILGMVLGVLGLVTKNYGIQALGGLIYAVSVFLKDRLYADWRGMALIFMLIAVIPEFFLIVRAKWGYHNPELLRINEAEPKDWKSFLDVLTRKQYEPAKIFPRRIPFIDQLKVWWLYFTWQYDKLVLPLFFLSLIGLLTHFANERKSFVLVGGVFLLGTLGMIIYMNLKDSPTMPINPQNPTEVRDRDYFYALGYTMIGLYAGIGVFELSRLIIENLRNTLYRLIKVRGISTYLGYGFSLLVSLTILVIQMVYAYPIRDRSGNYIAEDYSYNMLISPKSTPCVMYTNGDNDTFPLWFLQEGLKVRRDVIIANLSLLNTNWYVRQVKAWGAPISFKDEDIDKFLPVYRKPDGSLIFLKDIMIRDMIATSFGYKPEPYEFITLPGDVKIPQIYLAPMEEFVEKVVDGKEPKFPIYFAITVSTDNTEGLDEYLLLEGLTFKVVGKKVGSGIMEGVDVEYTSKVLYGDMEPEEFVRLYRWRNDYPKEERLFRYRGVFNPRVYKDRDHEKLIRNYASVAVRLALASDNMNEKRKSLNSLVFADKLLEQLKLENRAELKGQIAAINFRIGQLYVELGEYDKGIKYLKKAYDESGSTLVWRDLGQAYLLKGDTQEAINSFERWRREAKGVKDAWLELGKLYKARGDTSKLLELAKSWLEENNGDSWFYKEFGLVR